MSERGPEIKTVGLVAATPWYSFLQLNLIIIETNYCEKQIERKYSSSLCF